MKKLKIGDLEKIREKVRKTSSLRQGKARAKVTIHMGTCGIAAGARKILTALLEAIEKEIERIENERGKMTEQEKEKFRQNNLSKFLYTVKLKNFVETEYTSKDLKYDFED